MRPQNTGSILLALVVEDDPSWQQILSEILIDNGLEVELVDNREEADRAIRSRPHRLAVLDLSLGGIDHHNQDGLYVLEALRRHDPGCAPIFLTGFATVELAVDIIQKQGAFTCLRKETFRRIDFRQVIQEVLVLPPIIRLDNGEKTTQQDPSAIPPDEQPTSQIERNALVVEDDAGWRSLLAELLDESRFETHLSSSYVEALGLLKRQQFQLAVIDISLASSLEPGSNQDGLRLLEHTEKAGIPTILVSGFADPAQVELAYEEYHLFACLEKQAFQRNTFIETVRKALPVREHDPILSSLTGRERDVLRLLAKGMTNKDIAEALYISPNTVKRHLKSLFKKLGVNTRAAAVAKALTLGV